MTSKEIADLAAWTANSIQTTLKFDGRKLDDAGADIIREYVQTDLTNWDRGNKVTVETSTRLAQDIMAQRRHETQTENEVFISLSVLSSKFHEFVEDQLRQRAAEAKRLAATMPAIKV